MAAKSSPLLTRYFTQAGTDPYQDIIWEKRNSRISNEKGETVFALEDVEIPAGWSQLATDIIVSKYFRKAGVPGTDHEISAKQVVDRIVESIRAAGESFGGYFSSESEADVFEQELKYMMINQMVAFNSPVWFNVGLYEKYGAKSNGGTNWYWNFASNQVEVVHNNYIHPQCSACFIQSVDDSVNSMFDLLKSEAMLFKYGSGTGTNFSKIRGKGEKLSGGGTSSGLLSFLKVFDAAAGSIKSGGTTRRAAKMVCLDMDHPEIMDFITWKTKEEKKVAALVAAGYSADFNGEAYQTVTAQNANNSVRVTDQFLEAVEEDGNFDTIGRLSKKVFKTYKARELWDALCQSAWQCADPGVQYDTTINNWHTCPNSERINASNPCSEYMFVDNSACNLASINLVKFLDEEGQFDLDGYRHAIRLLIMAQEIEIDYSSYPTESIAQNSHDYRSLGLGYANLGSLLMRKGVPYDSPEAYAITGGLTAILTGHAYRMSALLAERKGAFNRYAENSEPMLRVIKMHQAALNQIDQALCPPSLMEAAREDWVDALSFGEEFGYRNAQVTLIAPTGTIGLLMDCDTTSIEPDFALVKFKKLSGGGYFKIVNQSVPAALANLGYSKSEINDIIRFAIGTGSLQDAPHINRESLKKLGLTEKDLDKVEAALPAAFDLVHAFHPGTISEASLKGAGLSSDAFNDPAFQLLPALGFTNQEIEEAGLVICGRMTVEGAPKLKEEHLPIFDCANRCGKYGTRFINPYGHLRIMAAAQPFLSGAISKTVNIPNEATPEEISDYYFEGWRLGLKAVAIYRDGSKLSQPLNTKSDQKDTKLEEKTPVKLELEDSKTPSPEILKPLSGRVRMPDERQSVTHKFSVGGHEGYITVGLYENGQPGEVFITMSKQGSVVAGLIGSFATAISIALQYQVPLEVLVNKFSHVRFEPSGMTNNPNIRIAKSIIDYIFRWLGMKFLSNQNLKDLGYNNLNILDESLNGNGGTVDTIQEKSDLKIQQLTLPESSPIKVTVSGPEDKNKKKFMFDTLADAQSCPSCGGLMTRNGSCYLCRDCGATSGCS